MSATPRNLPRFLPTLTEVVHPPGLEKTLVPTTPDPEALVQSVMRRIDPLIEGRLREETDAMVRALVMEQLQILRLRLHQEMEIVVRQYVSEAVASRVNPDKLK